MIGEIKKTQLIRKRIFFSTVENLGIYQIAFLPMILGVSIQAMVNQFMAPKLLL